MSNEWSGVALPWGDSIPSFIEPKDDRAILRTSVLFILLTRPGERVMEPTFGSRFLDAVFDQSDGATLQFLETEIREAIERWDDRVEITSFEADVDIADASRINVRVIWKNAKDPISEETQMLALSVTPTTINVLGG